MNFQGTRKEVVCRSKLLIFLPFGQWSGAISNISDGAGPMGSVPGGAGSRAAQLPAEGGQHVFLPRLRCPSAPTAPAACPPALS